MWAPRMLSVPKWRQLLAAAPWAKAWAAPDPLVYGLDLDSSAPLTGRLRFIPADPQAAAGSDPVVAMATPRLATYPKAGAVRRRSRQ